VGVAACDEDEAWRAVVAARRRGGTLTEAWPRRRGGVLGAWPAWRGGALSRAWPTLVIRPDGDLDENERSTRESHAGPESNDYNIGV
jgi:hypothetical protein